MYPRLIQFGHVAIPIYGAFIALALISTLAALVYCARRLALDSGKLWNLGLIAIFTALVGARLLLVAVYFDAFRKHPFWVLGLGTSHHSWISAVAVLLGITAGLLYLMAEGLPHLRVLDCVAVSVTVGLMLSSIGAFLGGVNYGLPAGSSWAVTYRSPFAAYWYGTPLAIRLYPVQLYQSVVYLAIFALLLWWLPRRRHDGELAGGWLFLAGLTGFFLDLYRAFSGKQLLLHQLICLLMVIASAAFLVRRKSGTRVDSYTGVDDPQHV